ncbi:hypothetical protein [Mucilaginibacter polytrichastri]|uniref:Uncharacterized protein n=1 Tax=Mucilaginibacter polytrichastri TaxID=1302689 RepID=A0A1Q6A0N1_9SPHI|nr:hypothetical protein [Mucilaginibacter polytrichastri]OKS87584.1 hypothetical protein RG47T_3045 [Mucilaginibacter polytrichastri]SFS92476.1 hypothetical protein SAMN04487890_106176 [Mucilaginibacter polytrichastri]
MIVFAIFNDIVIVNSNLVCFNEQSSRNTVLNYSFAVLSVFADVISLALGSFV